MTLRSRILSLLPASVRAFLRRVRRRLRWRSAKARGVVITKELLIEGLADTGVKRGDVLLVHSSLSSLGHVDGGANTVIDALMDVLGPEGTLMMPAYPATGEWMAYVRSDPLFDPQTSASAFGKITDVFRRRPGVLRSLHPTHSVAACGPHAEYLVRHHEMSPTPCGHPSPFRKLIELNGRILHLGSPFWATSSFHVVEDVLPDFPQQVYLDDPVAMRYLDLKGVEHTVPVRIHDPALVPRRIDKVPSKEQEIYDHCRQHDIVSTGRIGLATVHLIEARALEQLLEGLAAKGITIYAEPE